MRKARAGAQGAGRRAQGASWGASRGGWGTRLCLGAQIADRNAGTSGSSARLPLDERPRRRWEHRRRRAASRGAHQRQLKRGDRATGDNATNSASPRRAPDAADPLPLRRTRAAHGRQAGAQRWSTCAPAQQRTARAASPTTRRGTRRARRRTRPPRCAPRPRPPPRASRTNIERHADHAKYYTRAAQAGTKYSMRASQTGSK